MVGGGRINFNFIWSSYFKSRESFLISFGEENFIMWDELLSDGSWKYLLWKYYNFFLNFKNLSHFLCVSLKSQYTLWHCLLIVNGVEMTRAENYTHLEHIHTHGWEPQMSSKSYKYNEMYTNVSEVCNINLSFYSW